MKKNENVRFKKDPSDYGVLVQWVGKNDKFIPFPLRTPKKLQYSIRTITDNSPRGSMMFEIGSMYKLIDWIKAEKDTNTEHSSSTERGEWSGSRSMEHSYQIAMEGDPEINKFVKDESHRILLENKNLTSAPYGVVRDVEGMYFDVGLYLSGEPEAFYNTADQMIPDKFIDVHIQAVYSGNISVDHVKKQISNLVAAIASLEMSGYRVAVHVWWNTKADDEHSNPMVSKCVKEHRQPINIPILVGVTHPGFMRRVVFRIFELTGCDSHGYGHSLEHERGHKHNEIFYLGEDIGSIEKIISKLKKPNQL